MSYKNDCQAKCSNSKNEMYNSAPKIKCYIFIILLYTASIMSCRSLYIQKAKNCNRKR